MKLLDRGEIHLVRNDLDVPAILSEALDQVMEEHVSNSMMMQVKANVSKRLSEMSRRSYRESLGWARRADMIWGPREQICFREFQHWLDRHPFDGTREGFRQLELQFMVHPLPALDGARPLAEILIERMAMKPIRKLWKDYAEAKLMELYSSGSEALDGSHDLDTAKNCAETIMAVRPDHPFGLLLLEELAADALVHRLS
jgi:hypothetical protein